MDAAPTDVTTLLAAASGGSPDALSALLPVVYDELKRLAAGQLRLERDDHTLGATALVHEAFLRLTGGSAPTWENRAHFFGIAAQAMRRILVEHARRRNAQKRSHKQHVTLDSQVDVADGAPSDEVVAVDEALHRLAALDPRQAKVVELRYFVGLSIEESADVLGVSPATVKRDWALARAWLHRELQAA
ncbi:MAG TPA: sigma-70 family RNA polymerase sigma factor [Gemmatimonadales bacterium]|nr:sigma-70 family RNA polymerase sigma factor [Gemmatimonadales bacterium]